MKKGEGAEMFKLPVMEMVPGMWSVHRDYSRWYCDVCVWGQTGTGLVAVVTS